MSVVFSQPFVAQFEMIDEAIGGAIDGGQVEAIKARDVVKIGCGKVAPELNSVFCGKRTVGIAGEMKRIERAPPVLAIAGGETGVMGVDEIMIGEVMTGGIMDAEIMSGGTTDAGMLLGKGMILVGAVWGIVLEIPLGIVVESVLGMTV
ncbi:MAG: hypothetical protein F6K09_13380 [Merismopedia sp. SIO2A8]|nr:hypothetical protein [Merismopedia sp. SIO2A8]